MSGERLTAEERDLWRRVYAAHVSTCGTNIGIGSCNPAEHADEAVGQYRKRTALSELSDDAKCACGCARRDHHGLDGACRECPLGSCMGFFEKVLP